MIYIHVNTNSCVWIEAYGFILSKKWKGLLKQFEELLQQSFYHLTVSHNAIIIRGTRIVSCKVFFLKVLVTVKLTGNLTCLCFTDLCRDSNEMTWKEQICIKIQRRLYIQTQCSKISTRIPFREQKLKNINQWNKKCVYFENIWKFNAVEVKIWISRKLGHGICTNSAWNLYYSGWICPNQTWKVYNPGFKIYLF